MKFRFDSSIDYQLDAVSAVVDIFESGVNLSRSNDSFLKTQHIGYQPNLLNIDEDRVLANVIQTQKQNSIDTISEKLGSLDFSIEMETGTGKTYVYLRSMLELNKKYGLTKFIVLVPSIAIREGVMKTIAQTNKHFNEIYGQGVRGFEYNSSKLARVREFISSGDMQVMVMTVQSFNKESNVMRSAPDSFRGEKPIEQIALTNPVIIMDEPQNMSSDLSKAAISDLNPLFKLRYSATHKEKHNLLYRLGPVEAYERRLVKKVAVYGVEQNYSDKPLFHVVSVAKSPVAANVKLETKAEDGSVQIKTLKLRGGDVIAEETNNDRYDSSIFIQEVHPDGWVELSDGSRHTVNVEVQTDVKEKIFRLQIQETIKAHIDKQTQLGEKIKVLSLFFIDKVANYVDEEGLIRKIFDEEFEKLKDRLERFSTANAEDVRVAYFAKKNKAEFQDTSGKSAKDADAYDLIMKDKEKLLSLSESACFVFSHSALKEGWDNPNVFQICTLNETKSSTKKRQEIGRGLRLPVDVDGNRIYDHKTNVLTVIANESYQDFVETMQQEYRDDGYLKAPKADNARKPVVAKFKYSKAKMPEEFAELWERIKKKTTYYVDIGEEELVDAAKHKINEVNVSNMIIKLSKAVVSMKEDGTIRAIHEGEAFGEKYGSGQPIGDVIRRVADDTGLTKASVFRLLDEIDNLNLIRKNPEEFIRTLTIKINEAKTELILEKGLKYEPNGEYWELEIFEDINAYETNSVEVDNSVYDRVVFDGDGERRFALSLEESPSVLVYAKLPSKFKVPTPMGSYNPDWAIVKEDDGKTTLYLVRETKFKDRASREEILGNLRPAETRKIRLAEKHFDSIGVDFKTSTQPDLTDLV